MRLSDVTLAARFRKLFWLSMFAAFAKELSFCNVPLEVDECRQIRSKVLINKSCDKSERSGKIYFRKTRDRNKRWSLSLAS